MKIEDKRILVVGASSGIGREVALLFIEAGCRVAVAARRVDKLEELRSLAPDRVYVAEIDVTANDVSERINAIIDKLGGVDIYFHAAGLGYYNPDLDEAKEISTVKTNALGLTTTVDAVFNRMSKDKIKGHIAVISSIAQTKGIGVAPSYSATKRFQTTYITALDQLSRLQGYGITFTDIRPGFVKTDFLRGDSYPMLMSPESVAKSAFKAVAHRKRVATIDWKYRILTTLWFCIPRSLWVRLKIKNG